MIVSDLRIMSQSITHLAMLSFIGNHHHVSALFHSYACAPLINEHAIGIIGSTVTLSIHPSICIYPYRCVACVRG